MRDYPVITTMDRMMGTGRSSSILFCLIILTMTAISGCSATTQGQATPQGMRSVGLIKAKQALDREQAVFLDVRESQQYSDSHIPGALSIPLDALETRVGELVPSWWIIVYCDRPNEEDARSTAQYLLQNEFEKVNPMIGGFQGWISAGYPVEP